MVQLRRFMRKAAGGVDFLSCCTRFYVCDEREQRCEGVWTQPL